MANIVETLIVAMDRNRCIGLDNGLPWHLRADLRHFKKVTSGAAIIMGRKTYESIGKPLPERCNIVLSRQQGLEWDGVSVVHTLAQARALATDYSMRNGKREYFVIGGAEIYALALPKADCLYLTRVQTEISGDTWFPELDHSEWRELSRQDFCQDAENDWDFSILKLARIPEARL